MRTVELSPALAQQGQALWSSCQGCHGENGEGRVGAGPALGSESFLAAASDAFLFETIKEGRAGTTMIAWGSSFEDEQINALIAHIRSLAESEPAELNEGALAGDAGEGEQVFASICAGCHGRTGAGYQETANGTGIGRRAFLDAATNGYLRYIIRHGKTETQMRPFGQGDPVAVANLSDDDIENVIAYLRANAW
ncbi:MAG: c-type cytochrome [Myxococcales bacterium]|nr:c-type cytochrome [Myxococcales bacterium]